MRPDITWYDLLGALATPRLRTSSRLTTPERACCDRSYRRVPVTKSAAGKWVGSRIDVNTEPAAWQLL
jgi:hypothetical protein